MNAFPLQWSVGTKSVPRGTPAVFNFTADAAGLAALKSYAEVDDLISFTAEVKVTALSGGRFRVAGTFGATLVQPSVIDLEAVRSRIEEEFSAEYWPVESLTGSETENLPWTADPPEPIVNGQIAIGSLLSELFALAIDPYPRNDGDTLGWTPGQSGEETNPFAPLLRLKPAGGSQDS